MLSGQLALIAGEPNVVEMSFLASIMTKKASVAPSMGLWLLLCRRNRKTKDSCNPLLHPGRDRLALSFDSLDPVR